MRRYIIICILLLAAFVSCKKAKGPANGNSVQPNNNLDSTVSVTALVNGVRWKADSAYGYYIKSSGNDSGVVNLMIVALKKNTSTPTTFTFIINNFTGPNTYPLNPPQNSATYYIGNNRHYATIGQLIVASDTAYALKGTFDFEADTVSVSDGVFNVAKP